MTLKRDVEVFLVVIVDVLVEIMPPRDSSRGAVMLDQVMRPKGLSGP